MSEFLMIAPEGWLKVSDPSVFPYSAEYFQQYEGVGENTDVTQLFVDAGLIQPDQFVTAVKYIHETNDVWYRVR